jgi:hypothetical protein
MRAARSWLKNARWTLVAFASEFAVADASSRTLWV